MNKKEEKMEKYIYDFLKNEMSDFLLREGKDVPLDKVKDFAKRNNKFCYNVVKFGNEYYFYFQDTSVYQLDIKESSATFIGRERNG